MNNWNSIFIGCGSNPFIMELVYKRMTDHNEDFNSAFNNISDVAFNAMGSRNGNANEAWGLYAGFLTNPYMIEQARIHRNSTKFDDICDYLAQYAFAYWSWWN